MAPVRPLFDLSGSAVEPNPGPEGPTPARPRGAVVQAVASPGHALDDEQSASVLHQALEEQVAGERVLVLVPDTTRDVPMARIFPAVARALHRAASIKVMVALGTHPPMPAPAVADWLGLHSTTGSPMGPMPAVEALNHDWANPSALRQLGTITKDTLQAVAGPYWHTSLGGDLAVRVNRAALDADRVVIVGPTLPHEVAGFSGGAKYLFPGISGPEMIDVMHWLGALVGVLATIGAEGTPVRALIDHAASLLPTPVTMVALVNDAPGAGQDHDGAAVVAGMYAGDLGPAWAASVAQAKARHTTWLDRAYPRVISCPMPMYGELWTAGKAMYKLEPAVADGGELVIYAPHLSEVSVTHGQDIFDIGYHVLAYFLGQWERFAGRSLAVMAHSTHVKGAGHYDVAAMTEAPRVEVKLATQIPAADCQRLNLGYVNPSSLEAELAAPGEGTLVVRRAGEMLYRVS
jgi:lactate racemase